MLRRLSPIRNVRKAVAHLVVRGDPLVGAVIKSLFCYSIAVDVPFVREVVVADVPRRARLSVVGGRGGRGGGGGGESSRSVRFPKSKVMLVAQVLCVQLCQQRCVFFIWGLPCFMARSSKGAAPCRL